jgi:putative acetyltransferase
MKEYTIREDDLTGTEVARLLTLHLQEMHAWSPAESVHAMPIERLRGDDVTFYSAWDGRVLAACGAIKQLSESHGELKSMRADPAYRGKGAGRAVLDHLIAVARARGLTRLSLETGSTEGFEPARQLYRANGFDDCGPFGDYPLDPFSVFMTRCL